MSVTVDNLPGYSPIDVIGGLRRAVSYVVEQPLTGLSEVDLLEMARAVEALRRTLSVVDHVLIEQLDSRGVACERGARTTATLLTQTLQISPGEAGARVRAAQLLGPRRMITGEALAPQFTEVAHAQAQGRLSSQHAQVITATIEALPDAVADQWAKLVESTLVDEAYRRHPDSLKQAARTLTDRLDPDGILADERDHVRRRDVTVTRGRDGSGRIDGRLTPALTEKLLAVLDPLAAPNPIDVHGTRDLRTPGQRRHDALETALDRLLTSGTLPDTGGMPATVLITMTAGQYAARRGVARTGHGQLLSIDTALQVADQAAVVTVVHDELGRVCGTSSVSRVATKTQRLALAARDGGCSFPDCDVPAAWTQAHHVIEWSKGGPTTLDNLTLVCGFHHRSFERAGWSCEMDHGLPHWRPPAHIDPGQRPRLNSAHRFEPPTAA